MAARNVRHRHSESQSRVSASAESFCGRWPAVRLHALRVIVDGASRVTWSRRLLTTLLEELHVDDLFVEIVGHPQRIPVRRAAQAVAVALILRHSWHPQDLNCLVRRLGLSVHLSGNGSARPANRQRVPRR
jgi:hypothetical protein